MRASVSSAPLLAGVDVDRVDVAVGVILVGVEGGAGRRVEGDARHLVEHHAVEVGEMRDLAGGKVHPAEEADPAGLAEGGDQAVGLLVDEAARHRPEAARLTGASARSADIARAAARFCFLELVLEGDPVGPDGVERACRTHA